MTQRLIAGRDVYHLGVVALLSVVGVLPSARARQRVACRLGELAYRISTAKRSAAEANARIAYGGDADVESIVRSSFVEFWREMLEFTSTARPRRVEVRGLEHLREALDAGHGAILWESNGFGYRTASKKVLSSLGLPVHQVHGRTHVGNLHVQDGSSTWVRERLVRPFFDRCEGRWVAGLVYVPASRSIAFTRRLQSILDANAILCIAGDGQDGRRFIPVDFLGSTVQLATGMVSLAQASGARLLPLVCAPDETGALVLGIGPPIRPDPGSARDESIRAGLQAYATRLETHIRLQPGLYRNWHLLGERRDREGPGPA